jgi:two-component system cell cycle sensor histidine kinase/response regulator CckA
VNRNTRPDMTVRVLVVEHDAADAELNVRALERGGFTVKGDVVANVRDFEAALRERTYDLVIADYRLPSWTGMDALARLRALNHDTPLILVTGTLGDERAVECVKAGAADYVTKDNLGRLPIAAARAVDEHRARHELAQANTRTREYEAQAIERDARFTQLADTIREVFYLMDVRFRETLFINAAYEDVWGRARQTLYDNPGSFIDGVLPEDRPALMQSIARVQAGNESTVEFRVLRPDGTVRWLQSHSSPIRNERGEVYRISGVALDVTDRVAARSAIEERETRFRLLAEAAFDGVLVTEDGVIREVNRGFLSLFGLETDAEVIGRRASDFAAPESRELIEGRIARGIEGAYEAVARRRDGSRVVLEVTARNHHIDGRNVRISAIRDLTKQRTLEDQFRQAQKMEAIGRLAGGVAHDFNNLLTVIGSYAQFIYEDLAASDPRRADLTEIRRAADAAASLTRQLLAFSRQEVIQPRQIALGEMLASTDKMLRRVIGEDIALTTVPSETPIVVNVDPGRFEQVIMNLVVNARDAMPTGGKLTIETGVVEFDSAYAHAHWPAVAGTFAMVAVSDTGVGMDEQTKARIFEPFFTTKEVGKGTGLGLATVYGIVKQAGGFIWVYSEPGSGTTFKVYLPLATHPVAGRADTSADDPPVGGTETILVTEDAPAVRAAVRGMLERLGYTVLEAPSGAAALALATKARERIDVLLTDVVMPEMSGRELAEKFLSVRPDARVLFMSGYTDDSTLRHGLLSSVVAFVQKPFAAATLARKLREVIDAPREASGS